MGECDDYHVVFRLKMRSRKPEIGGETWHWDRLFSGLGGGRGKKEEGPES